MVANEKKTKRVEKAAAKPAAPQVQAQTATYKRKRTVLGTVLSNKMQKTIVVRLDRRVQDAQYNKFVVKTRKVKAHDEKNDAHPGDLVMLVESRPLSKDKRWALKEIVRRSRLAEADTAVLA